jgi:FKBP-type peptidyl-prolyl cis-trans isomerase
MINMKWTIWLAIGSLFTISCNQEKTQKAGSFDLIFYTNESGAKPQPGEYAYFQMDFRDDNDKLLQSYRDQKRMPSIKIPKSGSPIYKENPIPDALRQMSINDSVGIIIPKDSIPDLSSAYEDLVHVQYILVLKEILNEAEYQTKLSEERQKEMARMSANKARLPEIEKIAEETIQGVKAGTISPTYLENGLGYVIHEMGDGDMPTKDRMITAQYYGALQSNGNRFDDSFSKGRGYSFRIGRGGVIQGWDEGFMLFPVGTKASLFIPSAMGYGERGSGPSIPPNSDLYFYVEFEEMFY